MKSTIFSVLTVIVLVLPAHSQRDSGNDKTISEHIRIINTALWHAYAGLDLKVADFLINMKEEFRTAENTCGITPLMEAARKGYTEAAGLLVNSGAALNAKNKYNCTALMFAAGDGFIEQKLRPDRTFMAASRPQGHPETAIYLIKAGSDVNAGDTMGWTALMRVALRGNIETIKTLIEYGADVNAQDINGNTSLMCSAGEGHLEAVKILMAAGADVNKKIKDGRTALSVAARRGYTEIAEKLLKAGADPDIENEDGLTALDKALEAGHLETAELLRRYKTEKD